MHDQIIVAVFPSRSILLKAMDHLLEDVALDVQKAAVVVKSKTGKVLVLDDDLGGEDGGFLGGIVGAVVMVLGLAVIGFYTLSGMNLLLLESLGLIAGGGIGWLVGQFVARVFRFGFARDYIDMLADKLQEGHPALMLHVKDASTLLPKLQEELKPYKVEIVERLKEVQSRIQN